MTQQVASNDQALSGWLRSLVPSMAIFCRAEVSVPWGFSIEGRDMVTFHVLTSGQAWLDVKGVDGSTRLEEGDLVLLPTGAAHAMRHAPGTRALPLEDAVDSGEAQGKDVRFGGDGRASVMVCGGCPRSGFWAAPTSGMLPPLIRHPSDPALVALMERESRGLASGNEAVLLQVLSLLVTQALRSYLTEEEPERLRALSDPAVSGALVHIHENLGDPVRVSDLCARAKLSRTALTNRFREVLGLSPITYLRLTRLTRGADLLANTDDGIERIARTVGYSSAASFSRAFKQEFGESPGAYRRPS